MPSINGVDFNNISSLNGVSWNSVFNINGVSVSHGSSSPYKFYYLNVPYNNSGVSNTANNTLLESILIPANTFEGGGVLECIFRLAKIGNLAAYTWRIYSNTANTITGASLLVQNNATTNNNIFYNSTVRYFSLNQGLIKYLGIYNNQSDIGFGVSTPSTLGSATFNPAVDNYIILAVQPTSAVSDLISNYISFIRGYE
jgi:hypothetical protein